MSKMKKKILYLFGSGVGVFFLFVIFSYLVHEDVFTQFDFNSTVRLQDNLSRRFDVFFSYFSDIGSFEPVIIFLIVILFLRRKIIAGLGTFFLFGMFHIFELYGKIFVEHLPPPQFMLRTQHLVEFPQFHIRAEYSYPSGHSGRAVFLVTLLLFWLWGSKLPTILKVIVSGVLGVYALIMLLSRVYLGEHWASDVVGGAILGLSFGILSSSLYKLTLFSRKKSSTKYATLTE